MLGKPVDGNALSCEKLFKAGQQTPALVKMHRLWTTQIVSPQWEVIDARIRNGGDLVIGQSFPHPFRLMQTHMASWRLLAATWAGTDPSDPAEQTYERNFAPIRFPIEYKEYVDASYHQLQTRKLELLAQLHMQRAEDRAEDNGERRGGSAARATNPTNKTKTIPRRSAVATEGLARRNSISSLRVVTQFQTPPGTVADAASHIKKSA